MTWTSDAAGAAILGGAVLATVALAELWARLGRPQPETTRKLVHLGGGAVCLFFPYFIQSWWVVLAMSAGLSALFVLGRRTGQLRSLHGVGRSTKGSEYYPLAILLVFMMSQGRPWLHVSSVLVLAVADAFAALIGTRYGVVHYAVGDGKKSLEGSLAFLVAAFLSMHLPMLLLTDLPRATCVLAALLVAALVTGFEAVSTKGTDNLFVPLATCAVLERITSKPVAEIAYQNLSLLGIATIIGLVVYRVRFFNVSGTVVLVLFTYGAWSLGSEHWAFPAIAGLGLLAALQIAIPRTPGAAAGIDTRTAWQALLVPTLVLVLANSTARYAFLYGPYVAASALVLNFAAWKHLLLHTAAGTRYRHVWAAATFVVAWGLVTIVPWSQGLVDPVSIAATGGICILAAMANELLLLREPPPTEFAWHFSQSLLAMAGAAALAFLQSIEVITPWNVP